MLSKEEQFVDRVFTKAELEAVSNCLHDTKDKGILYLSSPCGKQWAKYVDHKIKHGVKHGKPIWHVSGIN